ncbi:Eaa protein [Salmonella enterica]
MTTITKERIELFIKSPLENGLTRGEQMELARIALVSLDAEPVGEVSEKRHGLVMDGTVDLGGKSTYRIIKGEKAMKRLPLGTKFYIAPPAPVVDADPVVFTDERNIHHIARGRETSLIWGKQNQEVGDIPLYRHAQPVPVDKEFIPKNLDKALGVVGVALPESKEEFNFQIERWIQRLIDRVIRYADEFKEQPAPIVPPAIEPDYKVIKSILPTANPDEYACCIAADMWNACRAAMLQGVEQPQNARQNIPENIPDGNSPAIPDDWVMVPKEPTQAMIKAWLSEVANWRGHVAGYKAALAAAPQREVK